MTDMSHHSKLVQSLDTLVAAKGGDAVGPALFDTFQPAGRNVALQMIVHAADISNTCRPPGPCGLWAKRVTDGSSPHSSRRPQPLLLVCGWSEFSSAWGALLWRHLRKSILLRPKVSKRWGPPTCGRSSTRPPSRGLPISTAYIARSTVDPGGRKHASLRPARGSCAFAGRHPLVPRSQSFFCRATKSANKACP